MAKQAALNPTEVKNLDRIYREGGLAQRASPHVHYHDSTCPHPGCGHKMEWIDFQFELFGDADGIYKPLVKSWWEGTGFAGRCPQCDGWIRFTTLQMEAINEDEAMSMARMPEEWHTVAQFG